MKESYTEVLQRMQQSFLKEAGYAADDASDIGIRLKVLAGEVYSLRVALDWLKRQTYATTAEGEALELRALEKGITRRAAQQAAGSLTFVREEPLWYSVPIPKGTVCTAPDNGERFITTEDAVLPVQKLRVTVPAQAEQGGAGGNTAVGVVTVLVTPPAGITQVINETAFTGGTDMETDEELRARLLERAQNPSNGVNAAFYEDKALNISGVFSAKAIPKYNGAGSVGLFLGSAGAPASKEAVQAVREALEPLREFNVQLNVEPAEEQKLALEVTVVCARGDDVNQIKTAVTKEIQTHFASLQVGKSFFVAALCSRIFALPAVRNVFFTTGKDTAVTEKQLVTLGELSVSVLEE